MVITMKLENTCECSTTTHGADDIHTALKDFYNPCDECGTKNEIKFTRFTSKKVEKK
jgi:hypothetical protein